MYFLSINVLIVLPAAVVMSSFINCNFSCNCDFSFISLAMYISLSTTLALSFSFSSTQNEISSDNVLMV